MIIPPPVAEYSHSHCYQKIVADLYKYLYFIINCGLFALNYCCEFARW